MKILAKQRLTARQLPPELLQLKENHKRNLADYFKNLGIDLNNSPYEKVSNEDALRLIKSNNDFGALLCFEEYSTRYDYVILISYKDPTTNRVKVEVYTASYRVRNSIKNIINDSDAIYFFKGNQKTKEAFKNLEKARKEDNIPDSQVRLGRDNMPQPYFVNKEEYDKSGYEKRNLQEDLAKKRLGIAAQKALKCVQGISKINTEEITKRLTKLESISNDLHYYEYRIKELGSVLSRACYYAKEAFKDLGYKQYSSYYNLAQIAENLSDDIDLINFVYSMDVSAFLRLYRTKLTQALSKI